MKVIIISAFLMLFFSCKKEQFEINKIPNGTWASIDLSLQIEIGANNRYSDVSDYFKNGVRFLKISFKEPSKIFIYQIKYINLNTMIITDNFNKEIKLKKL